jgi:two-component system sensor kinase FixL
MVNTAPDHAWQQGSPAELNALLDAAVDAIVLSDAQGRIVGFNAAAERLFGYALAEVSGQPLETLMPEPYRSEHAAYMQRYLATREPHIIGTGREVEGQKRNGEVFPAWLSVGEAVQGGERSFVGIIRDLSEQRAAERERHALESKLAHVGRFSLLGEMAAGIAHEINQPLAAIATYSEALTRLLANGSVDPASLAQACEGIAKQARRASQVVENLRSLTRKHEPKREILDVNALIHDAMRLVEADAHSESIPVSVHYAPQLAAVYGDGAQLQQVLLNLTRNAVDAMSDSTRKAKGIRIETAGDELRVQFAVYDHGPGISPRLAESIFHPFVTTKREGLGVGLAISRTIVEAHGGELSYKDNAGGGAVFVAALPANEGEELE